MILIEKKAEAENKLKKIPNVIIKIEKLMEYETAGDPMSDLRWTRKTTQKIADELASINRIGLQVVCPKNNILICLHLFNEFNGQST